MKSDRYFAHGIWVEHLSALIDARLMRSMTVRNKRQCFTYAMVDPAGPRELFMELNDQTARHHLLMDGRTFFFFFERQNRMEQLVNCFSKSIT